jgi:Ca2+-binding RTX toxin-like protein
MQRRGSLASAFEHRDLSISHNRIGDVLQAQGNLPAALESYIIPSEVEALFVNGAGLTGTGSGNVDTLLSTGGANILVGLGGNDIYFVNNIGDAVMEVAGDGIDTVEATVSYTLPANAEALYMLGSGLIGTGTNGAESLLSSGGANTLVGLGGDDLYYVNNIGDTVTEGAGGGFDIVLAGANYALPAEIEALYMIGSGLTGTGTLDADSLLSSGGANTLVGLYYVNNTNDVVTEAANGGFDSVHAFVDYTLPTNVEALYTIGSGLTGTGNSDANTLVTIGANTLVGDDGNDMFVFLSGSAHGATVADLTGDEGDVLVFSGFGTVAQGASFDPIEYGYIKETLRAVPITQYSISNYCNLHKALQSSKRALRRSQGTDQCL